MSRKWREGHNLHVINREIIRGTQLKSHRPTPQKFLVSTREAQLAILIESEPHKDLFHDFSSSFSNCRYFFISLSIILLQNLILCTSLYLNWVSFVSQLSQLGRLRFSLDHSGS